MNIKVIAGTVLAGSVILSTGAFAGETYVEPMAPSHDHNGCVNPGFSLEGGISYFEAQGDGVETDSEIGWRGTLRYQTDDGLFFALRGSYTNPDLDDLFDLDDFVDANGVSGDLEAYYVDFLIGDNFHNSDKFCLDISAGLRYASVEVSGKNSVFGAGTGQTGPELLGGAQASFDSDGWGPVIRFEGTRALSGPWSLYFDFTQAIIFTSSDSRYTEFDSDGIIEGAESERNSSDDVTFISEIGGGIQYSFGNGHLRLGGEGQYWSGSDTDIGIYGLTTSMGWNF